MTAAYGKRDRRIIPRWRSLRGPGASEPEGAPAKAILPALVQTGDLLDQLIDDWSRSRQIYIASDLIGAAFTLGLTAVPSVQEAARFLLEVGKKVPSAARELAQQIVSPASERILETNEPSHLGRDLVREAIHALKGRVRRDPRNAVARVELSRYYASIGQTGQALSQMRIALALAPYHRNILRAAARLFVHADEIEDAMALFRNNRFVRHDPWLVAAEIAVSTIVGRSPTLTKTGREMLLRRDWMPSQTSELASALGTLELESGSTRKAKRLFETSLVAPNDNAIAQAEWASARLGTQLVTPELLRSPLTFEARALAAYEGNEWRLALENSRWWLADEPFSSRPAVLGSFAASVGLQDFTQAIQICEIGLEANPEEVVLVNNLVFALASSGQLSDAEQNYQRLLQLATSVRGNVLAQATGGLLRFRQGRPIEAVAMYQKAIELAHENNEHLLEATASAYFLIEAVHAGIVLPVSYLEQAESFAKKNKLPGLNLVLDRARSALSKESSQPPKRSK